LPGSQGSSETAKDLEMKTEYIKYLLQACELKSMSKAAEKNSISPQGLGRAVKSLESEIGMELLVKSNSGVELTDFGKEIYANLKAIENEYDLIMRTASALMENSSVNTLKMIVGHNEISDTIPEGISSYTDLTGRHIDLAVEDKDDSDIEELFLSEHFHYRICTRELCVRTVRNPFRSLFKLPFYPVVNANSEAGQLESPELSDLSDLEVLCEKNKLQYIQHLYECSSKKLAEDIRFTIVSDRWSIMKMIEHRKDCIFFSTGSTLEYIKQDPKLKVLDVKGKMHVDIGLQSNFVTVDDLLYRSILASMKKANPDASAAKIG